MDDENKNVTEEVLQQILQNEFEHGSIGEYLAEEIPGVEVNTRLLESEYGYESGTGLEILINGKMFRIFIKAAF